MLVISLLYLFNFHVNDIWTPNESFYAEAVREMFESGNFSEFFYNYEPRYNKPPLTYWTIAGSVSIFGLNEFAIRLPIVLMALGAIWFTYLLGKFLYGEKGGLYAMVMMAFSVQLLAVKQYASPEVPLTFFFTACMYYFIRGYQQNRPRLLYLSYLLLGLSVLTKGFPYIIVTGAIVGLYILFNGPFTLKRLKDDILRLKLHIGVPVFLLVGLSWIIFMYLKDGQSFWEVYYRETFGRAFTKETNGLKPFFYIEVISWSILPYSLAFFFAFIYIVRKKVSIQKHLFPLCWLVAMLLIFTAAKGKIPTYMIQAHPAMLLLVAPLLLSYQPSSRVWNVIWSMTFLLPALLIVLANVALIYLLHLHWLFYIIPLLSTMLLVYFHFNQGQNKNQLLVATPFWVILGFLICFGAYMPRLEAFRPYDELGAVLTEHQEVDPKTPLMIEGTLIHNVPFYARRKVIRDATIKGVLKHSGPTLALVRETSSRELSGFQILWSGLIYDFPSESQFAKFIAASVAAEKGDLSKFARYNLVYRNQ
jgi:4-amino-4-deoxy-L-arabinose transferase-like glycosyltransferase